MQEHLSKQYDADLDALRSRLVDMASAVAKQFRDAVEALAESRLDLADRVVANDAQVNALELRIDDDCAHVIARRQPAASDLRMILGISKMATDLERIGDKARKIARLSASIRTTSDFDVMWIGEIRRLANETGTQLKRAIEAFERRELDSAVQIIRAAQGINRQSSAVSQAVMRRIVDDPGSVAVLLDVLAVTKAVDRIADHVGNLAEHLIYIVRGTDVRHATLDQIEQEALRR
jgi:phosphate transport system protein